MPFRATGERRSCPFHLHVHLAVHMRLPPTEWARISPRCAREEALDVIMQVLICGLVRGETWPAVAAGSSGAGGVVPVGIAPGRVIRPGRAARAAAAPVRGTLILAP